MLSWNLWRRRPFMQSPTYCGEIDGRMTAHLSCCHSTDSVGPCPLGRELSLRLGNGPKWARAGIFWGGWAKDGWSEEEEATDVLCSVRAAQRIEEQPARRHEWSPWNGPGVWTIIFRSLAPASLRMQNLIRERGMIKTSIVSLSWFGE